jgi:hypothetical protein
MQPLSELLRQCSPCLLRGVHFGLTGVFEVGGNETGVHQIDVEIDVDEDLDTAKAMNAFSAWSADVREQSRQIASQSVR